MKKTNNQLIANYTLKVGWLYPELMSTYGDRGNITVLKQRCEWRGIKTEIVPIDQSTNSHDLKTIDLLFGGGAQDREQEMVMTDLKKKTESIKNLIENNVPSLFVCGSPQLFGKYYEPSVGMRIEGLGIFDMVSIHPGPKVDRLIGNVVAKIEWNNPQTNFIASNTKQSLNDGIATSPTAPRNDNLMVGFENHGGRTYLGKNTLPFAKVIKGYGNNGQDGTEGVVYKNAIGSYLHGPLLPKNPEIADWLIKTALEIRYKKEINLEPLDDSLEQKAKEAILKKLNVNF